MGICIKECVDVGGVIRLHVLHDEVIRLPAVQRGFQIIQPLFGEILIHRVHNGDLFIQNDIRIVSHAVGDGVLSLKQVDFMVIYTNVANIVGNGHSASPSVIFVWVKHTLFTCIIP